MSILFYRFSITVFLNHIHRSSPKKRARIAESSDEEIPEVEMVEDSDDQADKGKKKAKAAEVSKSSTTE